MLSVHYVYWKAPESKSSRMSEQRGGFVRYLSLRSATAIVIANIIGAGIFTTTGFQAADLGHPGIIFGLWIVGGVVAFCGALCYSELGAAMPEAGGEYVYLRETYGPALAFMSAFVSLVAGFSAAIASALKSLVRYLSHFVPIFEDDPLLFAGITLNDLVAVSLVWLLFAVHLRGMRGGIAFNDVITLFKICGIVLIIGAAFAIGKGDPSNLTHVAPSYRDKSPIELLSAIGTSLIFVSFCYSGWNAAAYMAGEIDNPQRNLHRALLFGTGIVVLLYLGLNAVYFYGANVEELAGEVEVGLVASRALFGPAGVTFVTIVLCVSILASASAMTIAGPRVYYAFARDFPPVGALARIHPTTGAPTFALLLQGLVTTVLILSGSVYAIQQYAGFTLSLFASLAVSCVIVLRHRAPDLPRPFRAWGYPWTPALFLVLSIWTMFWALIGNPTQSLLGFGTVALGGAIFFALHRR